MEVIDKTRLLRRRSSSFGRRKVESRRRRNKVVSNNCVCCVKFVRPPSTFYTLFFSTRLKRGTSMKFQLSNH